MKEPLIKTKGWEYICFSDRELQSNIWDVKVVPLIKDDPILTARNYKILYYQHIEAEQIIWIDGSFTVNTNLDLWWKVRFTEPFTCLKHPIRSCIYAEAEECIKLGRGKRTFIRSQINQYRKEGLPANNGLIASGILMRNWDHRNMDFCDLWWRQLEQFSTRDQIGFSYAHWKMPITHTINWDYRSKQEFIRNKHGNKKPHRFTHRPF